MPGDGRQSKYHGLITYMQDLQNRRRCHSRLVLYSIAFRTNHVTLLFSWDAGGTACRTHVERKIGLEGLGWYHLDPTSQKGACKADTLMVALFFWIEEAPHTIYRNIKRRAQSLYMCDTSALYIAGYVSRLQQSTITD